MRDSHAAEHAVDAARTDKNTISARTERAFWEDGYQLLDRSE
jgi:hypothetical protein